MSPAPRQGPVKSHLEQLIGRHSRESAIATDRVRRWVSTMALLGALERAAPDHAPQRFLLKGGVAIELRVRTGARATKDVDANVPRSGAVVVGGIPGLTGPLLVAGRLPTAERIVSEGSRSLGHLRPFLRMV